MDQGLGLSFVDAWDLALGCEEVLVCASWS